MVKAVDFSGNATLFAPKASRFEAKARRSDPKATRLVVRASVFFWNCPAVARPIVLHNAPQSAFSAAFLPAVIDEKFYAFKDELTSNSR
jgi:hypothetical protein